MKSRDQHSERQQAMNEMDDIIKADFEWKADKMRKSSFNIISEKIETAIRSGNCKSALNTALVVAWYYPADLRAIGYGCEIARQADKCKLAYSVLDQVYRRAFVVLSSVATERGLDVAAVDAGEIALKDAYAPALDGNGTKYGLQLKDGEPWRELITGNEWDKLPAAAKDRLIKLQDVLSLLNHGVSNPILIETFPAPLITPATNKTEQKTKTKEDSYSQSTQKEVAERYHHERIHLAKSIQSRHYYESDKKWLNEKDINSVSDFNRCKEEARKNTFLPPWNRRNRKNNGKC